MSNATQALPARPRTAGFAVAWRRWVDAWRAWQYEREQRRIDRWYTYRRNAHERYLSRAQDHYDLERLERSWARNPDWWR